MFDPRQGIQIKLPLLKDQMVRYKNGLNNKDLFPLSLNSSIIRLIMRTLLYNKDKLNSSKKLNINKDGDSVDHVVGTPGMGKSWSFVALKLLHDKRIPSLMKNGPHKDSIFTVNYKLFYIHALTDRKNIVQQILDEVKTDFGHIPEKLK